MTRRGEPIPADSRRRHPEEKTANPKCPLSAPVRRDTALSIVHDKMLRGPSWRRASQHLVRQPFLGDGLCAGSANPVIAPATSVWRDCWSSGFSLVPLAVVVLEDVLAGPARRRMCHPADLPGPPGCGLWNMGFRSCFAWRDDPGTL